MQQQVTTRSAVSQPKKWKQMLARTYSLHLTLQIIPWCFDTEIQEI